MFDGLTDKLTQSFKGLRGLSQLNVQNIKEPLRQVRHALIDADVALPVVQALLREIEAKALGVKVDTNLSPEQAFIKLVSNELVQIMGEQNQQLNLKTQPPAVILLAGLQGSGKTTTSAKLAQQLKNQNKQVMLTSLDIYRPAAIDQLAILAEEIGVPFAPHQSNTSPVNLARNALDKAQRQAMDVLIVDTAGRLHVDDEMMQEIQQVHTAITPIETLFVVDSLTGQDAANTAKAFHQALPLTGVVLTKVDGDSRGGAALSVRYITGVPIKFMGTGEKTHALEPFHPDRVAQRILGMGDVLSLIEDVQKHTDQNAAQTLVKKIRKGQFDLTDFYKQLKQMDKMGGMANLIEKLPGMNQLPNKEALLAQNPSKQFCVIIDSMTPQERRFPSIINGSRRKRIASGSGTSVQDINKLIRQFTQAQKMMKKLGKKGGMANFMKQASKLQNQGGFPPDFPMR